MAHSSTPPTLLTFPSKTALARQLRPYVLQAQHAALARHDQFRIAVSGGSLPALLSQALLQEDGGLGEAEASDSDRVILSKWHIFFADERAVPLTHPDSNYKLLKDDLLDKLPAGVRPGGVYTLDETILSSSSSSEGGAEEEKGQSQLPALADNYETQLIGTFAARDSVRVPVFDLILLGCGPDGHTCSLFPGHEALSNYYNNNSNKATNTDTDTDTLRDSAWVLPIPDSPKPPPARITLSMEVVVHAARIAFVTTGDGKRDVLRQIFDEGGLGKGYGKNEEEEEQEMVELPSAMVNRLAGDKVTWFTDEGAVADVKRFEVKRVQGD